MLVAEEDSVRLILCVDDMLLSDCDSASVDVDVEMVDDELVED